jgi:two-component system OmpR family sensor kinase
MTLRLRLTLWYGTLFAVVLSIVILLSYVYHTRGHYDDLDRVLVTSAGHATSMISNATDLHLVAEEGGLEVGLRLYDRAGYLVEWTPGSETAPPLDPQEVLTYPGAPPFDPIAGLLPVAGAERALPPGTAFGLVTSPTERWRVYMTTVERKTEPVGYIVALSPLGRLDTAMARFRLLLGTTGLLGLAAVLTGSWLLASAALRPVAELTTTAADVAESKDLLRRVTVPPRRDELRQMAVTFNTMLGEIEQIRRMQQQFIADASHELRAPLTVIQGNLAILRRQRHIPPAEQDDMLAETDAEAARMARLVAELLTLARADAGVPLTIRTVDLDALVLETFQMARQLATGQTLVMDGLEPISLRGDADRLKQLLLIVLDNALKYTPPGGEVRLCLQQVDAQAEVIIRDSGIGIPPEALPHVFERFYRADRARSKHLGGNGLGLAIAQTIIRQHSGAISIQSQLGSGTTVTLRLPLLPSDPLVPPAPSLPA